MQVHPFVVLTSVLFGSTLFGILGALLAIPIAAAIQISIIEYNSFRRPPRHRRGAGAAAGPRAGVRGDARLAARRVADASPPSDAGGRPWPAVDATVRPPVRGVVSASDPRRWARVAGPRVGRLTQRAAGGSVRRRTAVRPRTTRAAAPSVASERATSASGSADGLSTSTTMPCAPAAAAARRWRASRRSRRRRATSSQPSPAGAHVLGVHERAAPGQLAEHGDGIAPRDLEPAGVRLVVEPGGGDAAPEVAAAVQRPELEGMVVVGEPEAGRARRCAGGDDPRDERVGLGRALRRRDRPARPASPSPAWPPRRTRLRLALEALERDVRRGRPRARRVERGPHRGRRCGRAARPARPPCAPVPASPASVAARSAASGARSV